MPRMANLFFVGVACLVATMGVAAVWQSSTRADTHETRDVASQITGPDTKDAPLIQNFAKDSETESPKFAVLVRKPLGPPRIELAVSDPQGRTGSVACSTCHSVRKPNKQNVSAATLDEFHQGMTFHHGSITCYSCHNPADADALRMADGTSVSYQNVMKLCSQCHGLQATSFAHGAHGGMNGHWDLNRGPQTKNNCIDCHDPHQPNYPKMIVGFKPHDRFNAPAENDHDGVNSHDDH